jgi:hypothetical protein
VRPPVDAYCLSHKGVEKDHMHGNEPQRTRKHRRFAANNLHHASTASGALTALTRLAAGTQRPYAADRRADASDGSTSSAQAATAGSAVTGSPQG